jgi:glycosyltransferase involved in cell wall biosynthesis
MQTVCVCTSVHNAWDARIFEKQIKTLLQKYRVIYVTPESELPKNGLPEKLVYIPIKKQTNRLIRIFRSFAVFIRLYGLRHQVISYHVHDPELAPVLALLKILTGKFCIYDVHENCAAAIRDRFWIPKIFRKGMALTFSMVEKISIPCFDEIITVSSEISGLYPGKSTTVIENFPSRQHYESILPFKKKKPFVLLAGGLTRIRGIIPAVQAFVMADLPANFRMVLLGWFESETLKETVLTLLRNSDKTNRVDILPWVPYQKSLKFINTCTIGIVPYLNFENHRFGVPSKIYEFLATATPIIYNNLPNYVQTIGSFPVGMAVDCSDPKAIARAMENLTRHPRSRKSMGDAGRKLFLSRFNWEQKQNTLLNLYAKIK